MNVRYGWLIGGALLALVAGGAALAVLQQAGVAPRVLARYVERRAEGHNPVIVGAAALAARSAERVDRGEAGAVLPEGLRIGAQAEGVGAEAAAAGREIMVDSVEQLGAAVAAAQPGDVLTMLPGHYRLTHGIGLNRPGTPTSPIVLRAREPGSVAIEADTVQAFVVGGSDWRVENLTIRGVCTDHGDCEHAFHVVAGGSRFTALNNTISDFNAHFKVNGEDGRFPDGGRIEGNTLDNSGVRRVASAVTAIDMVAVSGWTVRRNVIRDFIKGGGDQVSYGAYAKGAGTHNLFEQNVVLCESKLHGLPGARVGLSLGGGGSGAPFCRDRRCITEQEDSTLRANLIASCSDAGIYLNSAARSTVSDNTLLDTAGIDVRFAASSARLDGNLVDGAIRSRNDGVLYLGENRSTSTAALFFGWHPMRRLYKGAATLELAWADEPPRRAPAEAPTSLDLCGVRRPVSGALGAFEKFEACLKAAR